MTQEDKQVLLKDLSARVPYGVKADITGEKETPCEICSIDMDFKMVKYYVHKTKGFTLTKSEYIIHNDVLTIKPYLRPISTLTDEEMDKMFDILHIDKTGEGEDWIKINDVTGIKLFLPSGKWIEDITELYDYLYSIQIDFRGLIGLGLALEAPEGTYKIK